MSYTVDWPSLTMTGRCKSVSDGVRSQSVFKRYGKVFAGGRSQTESALGVDACEPRGNSVLAQRRMRRPNQAEDDPVAVRGDRDRLVRGRIEHLSGNHTAGDEFERRQFERFAAHAIAVCQWHAHAVRSLGQKVVTPLRQNHAKFAGVVGRGERLLPAEVQILAPNEGIRSRFADDGIDDEPRDGAAIGKFEFEIGRQLVQSDVGPGVVAMENLEKDRHPAAVAASVHRQLIDHKAAVGAGCRREDARNRPVVDRDH